MSANNALYFTDNLDFDLNYLKDIPDLIEWTKRNFAERSSDGEPYSQWGADLVGEQDKFLTKTDYQTERYGAECARWYALYGDNAYREKPIVH